MTIHVQMPEELVHDLQKAFPDEQIDVLVARIVQRAIVEKTKSTTAGEQGIDGKQESLVEAFERLAAQTRPATNDDIRRWRQEGRP